MSPQVEAVPAQEMPYDAAFGEPDHAQTSHSAGEESDTFQEPLHSSRTDEWSYINVCEFADRLFLTIRTFMKQRRTGFYQPPTSVLQEAADFFLGAPLLSRLNAPLYFDLLKAFAPSIGSPSQEGFAGFCALSRATIERILTKHSVTDSELQEIATFFDRLSRLVVEQIPRSIDVGGYVIQRRG